MTNFIRAAALSAVIAGALISAPVMALEHKAVIDHPAGDIAADYAGSMRIEMRQAGSAGPGGRASSLRCNWSVSLIVERTAAIGSALQAKRSMERDNALKGSVPGWCSAAGNGIERTVAAKADNLHATMMAMVAQDRSVILVEAEGAALRRRKS
ncbi:hypothetical protein OVA07_11650 [Novosphingobium sp. SL115]|uniref:hypothetical protein n=1 Tax=Novosphingobium sp. SL115 TaxID=2995150 RepID=UPI0022738B35|nr:hypothetical protein [Novosphingobium sp. SL115]MCY1671662.1 hypothetical protein [Novosphingobium sp. SL115]